jgi:two-component sensor histidine kinase
LGLAIHELTTNAIKFGVLTGEQGRLAVSWRVEEDDGQVPQLIFDWVEMGPGSAASAPEHRGFGLTLLEQTLPYELDAEVTVTFALRGLTCRIRLPLTEQVRKAA